MSRVPILSAILLASGTAQGQGLGACDLSTRDGVCLHGWAEAYYAYNFAEPRGDRSSLRLHDPRHDLFSVGNVALDAAWRVGPVSGRVIAHTGMVAGTFGPVRGSDPSAPWRALQEATVAWRTPLLRGLTIDAGIWATPFSFERTAVHENWNWSASTLLAASPYQLAGARVTVPSGAHLALSLGVFNGWDQVVDDASPGKTFTAAMTWRDDDFSARVLYAVGVERATGDPVGPWARHALAVSMDWRASARTQLRAEVFAGYEPGRLGDGAWVGVACYGRLQLARWLYIAARADALHEVRPAAVAYRAIFDPRASTLGSGTLTLDARPHDAVSLRLEYRHDLANGPAYVSGTSAPDPLDPGVFVPDARSQDTLLLGMTAWF